ncbi:unnamed protein product [Camellia sinensis]
MAIFRTVACRASESKETYNLTVEKADEFIANIETMLSAKFNMPCSNTIQQESPLDTCPKSFEVNGIADKNIVQAKGLKRRECTSKGQRRTKCGLEFALAKKNKTSSHNASQTSMSVTPQTPPLFSASAPEPPPLFSPSIPQSTPLFQVLLNFLHSRRVFLKLELLRLNLCILPMIFLHHNMPFSMPSMYSIQGTYQALLNNASSYDSQASNSLACNEVLYGRGRGRGCGENELKARWDVDKSMLEESKNVAENKYNEINEQQKRHIIILLNTILRIWVMETPEGGVKNLGDSSPLMQSKGYKEVKSIGAFVDQSIDVAGICNEAATLDQEDMVIDESNFGEPWVQGLMEGKYFDLSVEERLSAVVALIGVANEGNSIRIILEECLEAANALKKQMWTEVQLDKCRMKEEYVMKIQYPSCISDKTEPNVSNFLVTKHTSALTLQVREHAAAVLAGLMKGGDENLAEDFRGRAYRDANAIQKKRRQRNSSSGLSIASIHGAVLALAACVLSVPYDMPSWLPEHVTLLAHFVEESSPVKSTVTKAVAEFQRTHADTWNIQKNSFTEDQLEVLKLHLDHSGTQSHRRGSQSGGIEYAQSDVWASA